MRRSGNLVRVKKVIAVFQRYMPLVMIPKRICSLPNWEKPVSNFRSPKRLTSLTRVKYLASCIAIGSYEKLYSEATDVLSG